MDLETLIKDGGIQSALQLAKGGVDTSDTIASLHDLPFSEDVANRCREAMLPILLEKIRHDHFPGRGEVPPSTIEKAKALFTSEACRAFIQSAHMLRQQLPTDPSLSSPVRVDADSLSSRLKRPRVDESTDLDSSKRLRCDDSTTVALAEPSKEATTSTDAHNSTAIDQAIYPMPHAPVSLQHGTNDDGDHLATIKHETSHMSDMGTSDTPGQLPPPLESTTYPASGPSSQPTTPLGMQLPTQEPELSPPVLTSSKIPGIWEALHCSKYSSTHIVRFNIDKDILAAIKRWERRYDIFSPDDRHVIIRLLLLPSDQVDELSYQADRNEISSPGEIIERVLAMPVQWPDRMTALIIQVNENRTGVGPWHSHQFVKGQGFELQTGFQEGMNELRILQIGGMSDRAIILLVMEPTDSDISSLKDWQDEQKQLTAASATS